MTLDSNSDREWWLEWAEHWWRLDQNPLHAWRAIDCCLNTNPPLPLPVWCLPYLADAARKMTMLTGGQDFESGERIDDEQALDRVRSALSLSRQGKKNAFLTVREVSQLSKHVLKGEDAVHIIQQEKSVTLDRAKRLVKVGESYTNRGETSS